MKRHILSILCCCIGCVAVYGQDLRQEIEKTIQDKRAKVGVAVIVGNDTVTVANDNRYPIMSVFKFHIAVAALKQMESKGIALDSMVCIEQAQIRNNTYSPMRDKYPNQSVHITYRDIITYTVVLSDNNTCDWLIDFVGGIDNVDAYIQSLGIRGQHFTETENDMHIDLMKCYNNWSTPLAIAQLLRKVYTGPVLTEAHFAFLEETMLRCASGKDKLLAGLPEGVRIGHKTGHSDRLDNGVQICDADAGVVYLPNGDKCYVVVLIQDSQESDSENAKMIADICRATYQYSARILGFVAKDDVDDNGRAE